jgi:AraC-like DNA-binding protein
MYLDSETQSFSDKERISSNLRPDEFKVVHTEEFKFLFLLFDIFNHKLHNPTFRSEDLNESLGLSKSKTYRKIKSLTGLAPNQLIQELRLRKALKSLKQHGKTVAEVAYDLGFNSPTYFAKVFRKRFDRTPTSYCRISRSR